MSYRTDSLRPLLSAADEQRLGQLLEAGRAAEARRDARQPRPGDDELIRQGQRARTEFLESNVRLAINIASKMPAPSHIDRQDMIQDGMLGLERAVDKFDWRRGYKFSTYATWWIRQRVQRGMENTTSTIRIPAHRASELHGALRAVDGDFERLTPEYAELAARSSVISLDKPSGRDSEGTIGDSVMTLQDNPEIDVLDNEERAAIRRLLEQLDPQSRVAVEQRFGIGTGEPLTYAEIGRRLGIGTEVARRRVLRALEKLERPARQFAA